MMNHISFPQKRPELVAANGMDRLADELLMNFKVNGKELSNKSWDMLAEILDFVVEAEQTISAQKQKIEKLEIMTTTDPLTGLLNRRGIICEIEHAIAAADRHREPAVFVYIDLDGFKAVNDDLGHAAGDKLLSFVAKILQSCIRQTDYAARLGGDEFALLLTHADIEGGKCRSHHIQQKLNFAKLKFGGCKIPIRASFGIAEIKQGAILEKVLQHADRNMYLNKALRKSTCV